MDHWNRDFKEKYRVYSLDNELIADAVVIRLQDTFAPGALWAYANSVATMLDVIEDYGIEFSKDAKEELQQVHEYFVAMAVRADEVRRKLPTP